MPTHLLPRGSAHDNVGSIFVAPLGVVATGLLLEWTDAAQLALTLGSALIVVPTLLALLDREVRTTRRD
jgi:hypothetical protein